MEAGSLAAVVAVELGFAEVYCFGDPGTEEHPAEEVVGAGAVDQTVEDEEVENQVVVYRLGMAVVAAVGVAVVGAVVAAVVVVVVVEEPGGAAEDPDLGSSQAVVVGVDPAEAVEVEVGVLGRTVEGQVAAVVVEVAYSPKPYLEASVAVGSLVVVEVDECYRLAGT